MMILFERLTDAGKRDHLLGKLAAYFHEHRATLLPPLWQRVDAQALMRSSSDGIQWKHGFAHHVTVYGYDDRLDALAQLLSHPSGRFLVELGVSISRETLGLTPLLLERRPRALRSLVLDLQAPFELGPLWPALDRLHTLSLRGSRHALQLGEVALPALRHLALEGELRAYAPLLAASLPDLEQVDLQLEDMKIADVRPLLARTDLPKLTALVMARNPFTDDLCRELPESPLGARIKYLRLPDGMMTDAGARTFAEGIARLGRPPLEAITVTGNRLSRPGLASLRTIAKKVVDDH
jgi:hypothetical protein